MSTIIENESDIDEVISRIEKLQNKAKFTAFGKTKIKNRKSTVLNRDQGSIEAQENSPKTISTTGKGNT